jgi:hypothetical protein
VLPTGGEDVSRPDDVRPEELVGRPPDTGFRGDVENDVAPGGRTGDRIGVRQVGDALLDASGVQM